MKIYIFDFEVLPHEWLLVYSDTNGHIKHIRNNRKALQALYDDDPNALWVGYNCRYYDQYIFKSILLGFNPYEVSKYIIVDGNPGWSFSDTFNRIPLIFFDIMFDRNKSLKQLEGFMGMDIEECSIPWDLDRPMTDDEFDTMLHYCIHDVEATCAVFIHNMDNFKSYIRIIDEYRLPKRCFCKTKAQIASKVLGARFKEHEDEWQFPITDTVDVGRFEFMKDWFLNPENQNLEAKLVFDVDGMEVTIAWGGAHGASTEPLTIKGRLLNIDVASQYPSIMIGHNLLSRNITKKGAELFTTMKTERVHYKKTDPGLANAIKIVLNSAYGAMGDKNNALYDPRNLHGVCVNGQLMIMDLADKLTGLVDFIQINTDGILVNLNHDNEDKIIEICHSWEKRNRMELEFDYYDGIIQKDVNNYILIKDGKPVKRKGAWVKKLSPLDNDIPILRDGLVECLVYGKTPREVVYEHDDFIDFQKIIKIGGMYHHCEHNGIIYYNKVYRVYASTDPNDGSLMKCKPDKNPEKVGNTPEHCFIHNTEVNGLKCPKNLDKDWYVSELEKRVRAFKGEDVEAIDND